MRNGHRCAFLLLALPVSMHSQPDISRYFFPPAIDSSNAAIRFERNLNTYLWNLRTDYARRVEDFSADAHERYSSSFIRRDQNSRRDEQNFWFNGVQKISSMLGLRAEASSFILSDNQALGVSNAALHSGLLGLAVQPVSYVTIAPLVGFRFDRQQNEQDEGWNYKLLTQTDTLDLDGYETQGLMRLNVSNLSPRYFRNNNAQATMRKDFIEGSSDSLRLQWSNNRWDFYVPADSFIEKEYNITSNIRSRVDENFYISNSLLYGIGRMLSASVRTIIETRTILNAFRYKSLSQPLTIPYNITVSEQRLEGGLDLNYRDDGGVVASVGARVGERDEKHLLEKIEGVDKNIQENRSQQEHRLDNIARRTSFRASVEVPISFTDQFGFESSAGILRYDTPDSMNNDDRDELLINVAARETHGWNRFLWMNIIAEATLSHIVYLFQERSANNNWNRIFRLQSILTYVPARKLRMVNAFEVLANYTVFDFESVVPTVRSYLYRQFAILDSTLYDMSSNVGFDLFFHARIYERGGFRWQEFSERPQQYVREVTFSPALRYTIDETVVCAVGFRSFAQNRFRYESGTRVADGNYFSYGPTTAIVLSLSGYSRFEIQGWKEFQQQTNAPIREVSNVTMSARVFF